MVGKEGQNNKRTILISSIILMIFIFPVFISAVLCNPTDCSPPCNDQDCICMGNYPDCYCDCGAGTTPTGGDSCPSGATWCVCGSEGYKGYDVTCYQEDTFYGTCNCEWCTRLPGVPSFPYCNGNNIVDAVQVDLDGGFKGYTVVETPCEPDQRCENGECLAGLKIVPSSLNFGTVDVGSSSVKSFTITNEASETIVGLAYVSSPFSCISGCYYYLTSGQSKTVSIKFSPTLQKYYSKTVYFTGSDSVTATVTGEGHDPVVYYTLSVSKSGTGSGTVTDGDGKINCGSSCSYEYVEGTSVTLYADASEGSEFAGWSGACSGAGNCVLTMTSAKSVTATFNSVPQGPYTLTVSKDGTGSGTVTSSPSGIDCGSDCDESYAADTSVTLSAEASVGSVFAGWSGACSGAGNCELIMDSGKSVTATFTMSSSPTECDLTSAIWSSETVKEGTSVNMEVEGTTCTDVALSFDIYRDTTYIETIYDIFPSSSWEAGPYSSTAYYFIAKVVENPSESVTSNDLLVTNPNLPEYCSDIAICNDYTDEDDCNSNICEIDFQNSIPDIIDCDEPDRNCKCIWEDSECKASWTGNEGYCGDGIVDPGETCDGDAWGDITGCTSFDEFTGGTLSCNSPGAENECHFNTFLCTGGTSGICGDGVVNAGEECDEDDWGSVITGCSYFDEFLGGTLICDDYCYFDTSSCTPPGTYGGDVGTCVYTQDTDDTCDDGFLTFYWTAQWTWDEECDSACRLENSDLEAQCVDGQKTVECPAQIPLPFFNIYSFIAALVIIALIYAVVITKKKTRR